MIQGETERSVVDEPGARNRYGASRGVLCRLGPTAIDIGLLTSFWLLFFWAILVRRDHFIPYDLLDQHYMFQQFIHHALQTGASPWWTPNIVGGYPIAADPLSALFYPPNLLMHLVFLGRDLLPYYAMEAQAALHFLWAALGTYFLARYLTGSRAGALLASLSWAFGAFFVWHTPHLSPISTLSWLPWILLCYAKAVRGRSLLWTALGALTFAMMALAGHALAILQIGYLVVAVTLVVVWHQWGRDRRAALTAALIGAAVLTLGCGLAAVQLLPSLQLSGLTERADFTYQAATTASYAPHLAVTFLLPNFFSASGPAPYWGAVSDRL